MNREYVPFAVDWPSWHACQISLVRRWLFASIVRRAWRPVYICMNSSIVRREPIEKRRMAIHRINREIASTVRKIYPPLSPLLVQKRGILYLVVPLSVHNLAARTSQLDE